MAEIKTIYKGESVTFLFTFPETYNMERLSSHKVFVGETEFAGVKDGQTVKLQLKSSDTDRMVGNHKVVLWMEDTTLGLRKPYCGDLVVARTQAAGNTVSVSNISDIIIPIVISETAITVGDVLYNYMKGGKGDPFTYEDFTPEQIAELQQPATDAIASIQATELAVEQAEELRVTAEDTRQTNTAIAITNANNAATNANTKAGLADTAANNANEKATLANDAALLANEKAGLANTAATNADNARLAIQSDLGLKLDKTAVKQATGTSTTDVMSQKAVTDELAKKHQVVVDYTHTGNKEVNIESIDFATGTITATGHGLAANNDVFITNNQDNTLTFPYVAVPNGLVYGNRYYPVNITTNTFQLSTTVGGSPIVLSDKATKDYTKWHLERWGQVTIANLSLRKFIVEFSGRSNGSSGNTDYFYLYGGKNYGVTGDVWHVDTERQKITTGTLGRSLLSTMLNGDIWMYNRLEIDVTGKRATILVNGYRIYSVNDTTRGIVRHINEVAVHSTAGEDIITSFNQQSICNGINIKVTKIL